MAVTCALLVDCQVHKSFRSPELLTTFPVSVSQLRVVVARLYHGHSVGGVSDSKVSVCAGVRTGWIGSLCGGSHSQTVQVHYAQPCHACQYHLLGLHCCIPCLVAPGHCSLCLWQVFVQAKGVNIICDLLVCWCRQAMWETTVLGARILPGGVLELKLKKPRNTKLWRAPQFSYK